MKRIELGVINRTFGLHGEMRVFSETDFPSLRFQIGAKMVLVSKKRLETPVTVSSFRDAGQFVFLSFEEITSIEEAEKHIHDAILVNEEDAPLPEGYYRNGDLVGLEVRDEDGELLGTVKKVETNAPTPNLRVGRSNNQKDFFVPFLFDQFIVSVDLDKKQIIIKVMEGMLS